VTGEKNAYAQQVERNERRGTRQLVPCEQPPESAAAADLQQRERGCGMMREGLQPAQQQTNVPAYSAAPA